MKEQQIKKLKENYLRAKNNEMVADRKGNRLAAALYRDEQRKIEKVFLKMFHKPIDKS